MGRADTLLVASNDRSSRMPPEITTHVYSRVADRIQTLRKRHRLSRKDLADRAKVGLSYLVKVEGGERRARLDVLERLTGAMGEPLWRLFADQRMAPDEEEWQGDARKIMEIIPRLLPEDLRLLLGVAERLASLRMD